MGKIDSTLQYLLHLFLFDRLSKNCILDATDYNIGSQMNRLQNTEQLNDDILAVMGEADLDLLATYNMAALQAENDECQKIVENSYRNYDWKNKSIVELLGTGNKIL
jgi:hypothetical protein